MKLRNYLVLLTTGITVYALSSCSSSLDIAKRQHRPGYYVNWGAKNSSVATVSQAPAERGNSVSQAIAANTADKSASAAEGQIAKQESADLSSTAITTASAEKTISGNTSEKTKSFSLPLSITKEKTTQPSTRSSGDGSPIWSILSFVFALLGLYPPLSLICGLLAIIFGAIGFNKNLKGLAIVGLVLGILEVLVIFLVLAVLLAVL